MGLSSYATRLAGWKKKDLLPENCVPEMGMSCWKLAERSVRRAQKTAVLVCFLRTLP